MAIVMYYTSQRNYMPGKEFGTARFEDVYKRQGCVLASGLCRIQKNRESCKAATCSSGIAEAGRGETVSYTHLDVYKRQIYRKQERIPSRLQSTMSLITAAM